MLNTIRGSNEQCNWACSNSQSCHVYFISSNTRKYFFLYYRAQVFGNTSAILSHKNTFLNCLTHTKHCKDCNCVSLSLLLIDSQSAGAPETSQLSRYHPSLLVHTFSSNMLTNLFRGYMLPLGISPHF